MLSVLKRGAARTLSFTRARPPSELVLLRSFLHFLHSTTPTPPPFFCLNILLFGNRNYPWTPIFAVPLLFVVYSGNGGVLPGSLYRRHVFHTWNSALLETRSSFVEGR